MEREFSAGASSGYARGRFMNDLGDILRCMALFYLAIVSSKIKFEVHRFILEVNMESDYGQNDKLKGWKIASHILLLTGNASATDGTKTNH